MSVLTVAEATTKALEARRVWAQAQMAETTLRKALEAASLAEETARENAKRADTDWYAAIWVEAEQGVLTQTVAKIETVKDLVEALGETR